jgi:hypothetical protein
LHAFGFAKGSGWVRYVPEMIRHRVDAHCAVFPTRPTSEDTPPAGSTSRSSALRGSTLPAR